MKTINVALLTATMVLATAGSLRAEDHSTIAMAKAAQNPLANFVSLPFQNNTNYELGPYDRTQNVLNFQPVIPLKGGRVITRTILPFVSQPDLGAATGGSSGLGDIQFTGFYSPVPKGTTWGVGPILSVPSGGSERGSGKWSAGVSAVALKLPGPWVLGVLVNNIWSFAGDDDRADVNEMLIQYFVNYNFGQSGWYLSSAPIITANWEADSDERWIVPFGLAAGKMSRVGSKGLPVNLQAGAFYHVVRPDYGPNWSLRVQLSFLLPASML